MSFIKTNIEFWKWVLGNDTPTIVYMLLFVLLMYISMNYVMFDALDLIFLYCIIITIGMFYVQLIKAAMKFVKQERKMDRILRLGKVK